MGRQLNRSVPVHAAKTGSSIGTHGSIVETIGDELVRGLTKMLNQPAVETGAGGCKRFGGRGELGFDVGIYQRPMLLLHPLSQVLAQDEQVVVPELGER